MSASSTRWATRSGRAGPSPTARRSRPSCPRSCASTSGRRDRELALVGIALGVATSAESDSTAAAVAIGAIDKLLRDVDQRPSLRGLGLADDAAIDRLVTDTLDDAAIRNSPRLPTAVEARAILEAVAG